MKHATLVLACLLAACGPTPEEIKEAEAACWRAGGRPWPPGESRYCKEPFDPEYNDWYWWSRGVRP